MYTYGCGSVCVYKQVQRTGVSVRARFSESCGGGAGGGVSCTRGEEADGEEEDDERLSVSEFCEGDQIEDRCHELLLNLGVTVLENFTLRGVLEDKSGKLKSILLEEESCLLRLEVSVQTNHSNSPSAHQICMHA